MTVSKLFSHTVQQWYDINGDVPCTSQNGRTGLVSVYRQVYPNKNDKQRDIAVRNTVHLPRRLILPTHSHHHPITPNIANETTRSKRSRWSYNQYWNPIYNPINSARAKIVRRELNIKLIQCDPIRSSRLLNNNTINRTFNDLYRERKYEQFGGMTLEEAMDSGNYAVYVGITKRTLVQEGLRWLTTRGANSVTPTSTQTRNRSVLQWPTGENITMKEAINVLGGNYFIVNHSQLRMNEKPLEDKIQGAIHHHPLGRRLH